MSRITGSATVQVDGEVLLVDDEATVDLGGATREAVTGGGKVQGYTQDTAAPSLSLTVRHKANVSLTRLKDLVGATVRVKTDTGKVFTFRDAFTTNTAPLSTGSGDIDLQMSAMSVDEE